MANRRARRSARSKLSKRQRRALAAAIVATRRRGCTCEPDVTLEVGPNGEPRGLFYHDDHCSLLRSHEGPGPLGFDVFFLDDAA